MKILVAIDDSAHSQAAVAELGSRPWWGDTQFRILHVCSLPSAKQWEIWGMDIDWKMREQMLASANSLIEQQTAQLRKMLPEGIVVEGKVLEGKGHVSEDIAQEAGEWQADLIVVGSHGRTGFEKLMLGSVAQEVLACAPCSVEIIKSQSTSERQKKAAAEKAADMKTGDMKSSNVKTRDAKTSDVKTRDAKTSDVGENAPVAH